MLALARADWRLPPNKGASGVTGTVIRPFGCGTELSVGEWQRPALARALVRDAPILQLDERTNPTSAMDPWAGKDWLRRFRSLARGRTAVIITHRVTTAMAANLIHIIGGAHCGIRYP